MADTHELRLKINAAAAKSGAREFVGAINSIKAAVEGLDKATDGAMQGLDTSKVRAAGDSVANIGKGAKTSTDAIRRLQAQIQNTLTTSTNQAARLTERLRFIGDDAGITRVAQQLDVLSAKLAAADRPVAVTEARAEYNALASELNRAARAQESYQASARAAARSNQEQAAALDSLRAKHNPLYAASKQYESALEEIALAEREGAISAQLAADARERAAASLTTASVAADRYGDAMQRANSTTQAGVMVGMQAQDVLVQAQMGFASAAQIGLMQGTQLVGLFQTMKGGGSIMATLAAGLKSLISPLSLIVIGATIAAAAVAKFFFSLGAGGETKSFADALRDANSQITALRSATDALAGNNLAELRRQYGAVNAELDAHLERLRKIAELEAGMANANMVTSIQDALVSDGNVFTTDVDAVRRAFDTTNDRARTLLQLMEDVRNARTFEEQAAALTKLRSEVESTTGGLDKAEGAAKGVLIQLVRAEDAALRLKAAQDGAATAARNGTGAAASLAGTIGTAADEAARLLANLGSVPAALSALGKSVEGQIASIQAQNASLTIQIEEGWSAAAANRRVQLDTMISTAGERGQVLNFDQIASEYGKIAELEGLAKEQAALRERLANLNKPPKTGGSSGGRAGGLSDEAEALKNVNESLKDRLTSLQQERIAIMASAQGIYENAEANRLFAEAVVASGGAIDAQTAAMLAQIDAAITLNKQLTALARNPAREFVDSVPTWVEAGNMIEEGVIGNIRDALRDLMTGDFTWEKFGDAMLGTFADIMADQATKELLELFNLDETGLGFGKLFGALGGEETDPNALMAGAGGGEATAMQNAFLTGGQQAATMIQNAMVAGANGISTAGTTAGANMSAQVNAAGVTAGVNMNTQVTAGGTVAGNTMYSGIVQGGNVAAQNMAQASGGGGGIMGGGMTGILLGAGLGLLSSLFNSDDDDDEPEDPKVPIGVRQFAEGTHNTSGIPAILHPNEAVIPLSKGRKVPVELKNDFSDEGDGRYGGAASRGYVFAPVFNVQTPDADSFRRSQSQLLADAAGAGARAQRKNG